MNSVLQILVLLLSLTGAEPPAETEALTPAQLKRSEQNWFQLSSSGGLHLLSGNYVLWDFALAPIDSSAAIPDSSLPRMTRVEKLHVLSGDGVYDKELLALISAETHVPEEKLQREPPVRMQAVLEDGVLLDLETADESGFRVGEVAFELRRVLASAGNNLRFGGRMSSADMLTLAATLQPGVPVYFSR